MKYQEDFTIDKKFLNLIDKHIYNTVTDNFGIITGIEITSFGMSMKAYYSKVDSDSMVFFDDFAKGGLKFVIVKDTDFMKKMQSDYENYVRKDIESIFGDKFTEDMILYCENEECKRKNKEKEESEIKHISGKLINLKKLSAEIFYDDYTTLGLYKKYSDEAISELEMLYGICNHLCEEIKRLKDDNLNYFIAKYNHEQAEFLVDYVLREKEVEKKNDKIIPDKGELFELLDKMREELE